MSLTLDPSQVQKFQDALLDAFSPGELRQVVTFSLGKSIDQIARGDGNFTDHVFDVVTWANRQQKIGKLLAEARSANPGNPSLQAFELTWRNVQEELTKPLPSSPPPPSWRRDLRARLLAQLQSVPAAASYQGRMSLLAGIPGTAGLNRDPGNQQLDLALIVDQMYALGRLASGEWPLLLLLDNAASFVQGTEVETNLQQIGQQLGQIYAAG